MAIKEIKFNRRPGDKVKRQVSSHKAAITELNRLANACLFGSAIDRNTGQVIARVVCSSDGVWSVEET